MGFNAAIYALSKKYTDNTTDALGGVKGAPATIKSITEIDGGHRVTFEWTGTSGKKETSTLDVMNGVNGKDGKDGIGVKGDPGTNGSDGADGIGITSVAKTKTEGLVDTYTITFTDGSTFNYDVTNGKDGKNGSGSSTGEENVIESIKVNGVTQTVAEDKSVDITVPSIEGLAKSEDLATVAKSGSYNDLTDTPSIPNEYDDTALKNRVVTIETNIGDMSTIKIKSVSDLVSAINALHDSFMSGISYTNKKITIAYRNGGKVEVDLAPIITDTEISELENVDDTGVVDKQVLAYDATSSKYKPISIDLASVLQDSKAYTDTQISKINSMDAYAVDEKPTYSDGIITYKKNGETLTTENSDIWFYYTVNDMNYQTLFIDGVEFTISVDGDINFKDFVSKSNDLTSTYTGEEADKTKVTTIGALDALYTIISTAIGKKVNTVDIVDNLESDSIDKPLSAHQGKVLDSKISENTNSIKKLNSDKVDKIEGKGLSSNDYTSEEKTKLGGVGTSQGRNLISYPYYNGTSYESNGVTYTVNKVDGTITVDGKATKESDFRLISPYDTSDRKILELGQTYTLSDGVNQPSTRGYQAPVCFQFVRIDTTKNDFNYGISTNYGNMTWTASDANLLQYGIRIVVRSGVTVDNVVLKPMLEIGAIAHNYEPTTESNISLKSAINGKADKSKVADVNWTSVDISSNEENTSAGATINYCIKNGICYMSILNIGFKTANQAIILGANSIPKPSSDYCWSPLVGVTDPSYSVLIHPNVSGGLEHHSVGLTSQIYSGLFSYPVAES